MIKGTNRNVIVVRTDKDSRFESVYFVMKKNGSSDHSDMLKEANSIICKSGMLQNRKMLPSKGTFVFLGALLGFLISSLLWMIIVWIAF